MFVFVHIIVLRIHLCLDKISRFGLSEVGQWSVGGLSAAVFRCWSASVGARAVAWWQLSGWSAVGRRRWICCLSAPASGQPLVSDHPDGSEFCGGRCALAPWSEASWGSVSGRSAGGRQSVGRHLVGGLWLGGWLTVNRDVRSAVVCRESVGWQSEVGQRSGQENQ